jgi:hypothetical protein
MKEVQPGEKYKETPAAATAPAYKSDAAYIKDLLAWGQSKLTGREQEAGALLKGIEARSRESVNSGVFLPLEYLFAVFRLTDFERHAVRLALLPELDTRFAAFFAEQNQEPGGGNLSPATAVRLYDREEDAILRYRPYWSPDGSLRRFFFSGREKGDQTAWTASWKLDRRIRDFILEGRLENSDLTGFCWLWEPEAGEENKAAGGEEGDILSRNMARFVERGTGEKGVAFFLTGPPGVGKKRQIIHFCQTLHQAVLFADMRRIMMQGVLSGRILAELCRESVIRQSVLCFDGLEELLQQSPEGEVLALSCLEQALSLSNLVFGTARGDWTFADNRFGGRLIPVILATPDAAQRRHLWRTLAAPYPLASQVHLEEIADKFSLTPGQIKDALAQSETKTLWQGLATIGETSLYESCYSQIKHGLQGSKARKVPVVFTWEDLILPLGSKGLLRLACNQVRYKQVVYKEWGFGAKLPYGRGLSLLFSGPPGTGKTMGAQVVAGELKLELYKVDLAGVVSKYIGETEKNLREIFREAAKSQAVLFFDEADVLFNKRTEVREANDKYSNMEAAFMLQEIEEYEGVCILATNYLQNIDEAFKRRLKFIIEFPFPNAQYRQKLWHAAFPATTPLGEDIDWEYLARRFELSGSNIKNIALNAAFVAAAQAKNVTMAEILLALRNELAKSGKILSPEEFGEYYMLL